MTMTFSPAVRFCQPAPLSPPFRLVSDLCVGAVNLAPTAYLKTDPSSMPSVSAEGIFLCE